jgi:hypothetical protein
MERRKPKIKLGRRKSDIPVLVLEKFKDELKLQMETTVKSSIEAHVNGGIRGIKKQLDDYIVADTQWKEDSQPAIDNMKNMTVFGKTSIAISIGVSAVIGAYLAIRKLFGI